MNIDAFKPGCLKQQEDPRDHNLKPGAVHWTLINDIDLRPNCLKPRAQGSIASCTAFAATGLFDFVRKKNQKISWLPSPLFTYYASRALTNNEMLDTGVAIRDALKSAAKDGVSMERIWPYIESKFNEKPPEEAYIVAEKHQALEYLKLNDFDKNEWLNCLNDGYPFIFGLNLYTSFFDPIFSMLGGYMQEPDRANEKFVGAHCMMAVGYIKNYHGKEYLIVQNSWGENWGAGGYCYIPLSYIMSNDSFDFWTIRVTEVAEDDTEDPVERKKEEPVVVPIEEKEESVVESKPVDEPKPIVAVIENKPPVIEKKKTNIPFIIILALIGLMLLFFVLG